MKEVDGTNAVSFMIGLVIVIVIVIVIVFVFVFVLRWYQVGIKGLQ